MLVGKKWSEDSSVDAVVPLKDFPSRIKRKLRRGKIASEFAKYASTRPAGLEPFSDDRTEFGPAILKQLPRHIDIINLHWVAGFLDHESFFTNVPKNIPLVWRLADMAPCTGGCHYDEGCGKFENKCGACPQLGSRDENDLSRQVWQRKYDSLHKHGKVNLVATSNWIATAVPAEAASCAIFPVTVIPNGLDPEEFAPRDKSFARATLGLPQDARIVLFAAESLAVKTQRLRLAP